MRGAELLGPAPLLRLRGRHRAQLVAKTDRPRAVAAQAARLLAAAAPAMRRAGLAAVVDVDPQSLVESVQAHCSHERRPRAEEILGEWGVRDVTPPSQRERERLEADRDVNPLVGTPLRRRLAQLPGRGRPLPRLARRPAPLHAAAAPDRGGDRGCTSSVSRRPTPSTAAIPPAGAGSPSAGTSAR